MLIWEAKRQQHKPDKVYLTIRSSSWVKLINNSGGAGSSLEFKIDSKFYFWFVAVLLLMNRLMI